MYMNFEKDWGFPTDTEQAKADAKAAMLDTFKPDVDVDLNIVEGITLTLAMPPSIVATALAVEPIVNQIAVLNRHELLTGGGITFAVMASLYLGYTQLRHKVRQNRTGAGLEEFLTLEY
jgi:hypothetical protein